MGDNVQETSNQQTKQAEEYNQGHRVGGQEIKQDHLEAVVMVVLNGSRKLEYRQVHGDDQAAYHDAKEAHQYWLD